MPALPKRMVPPAHVQLPESGQLRNALLDSIVTIPPGTELIRAAWNVASVWPRQVERTYRFGPPAQLAGPRNEFPFHWIYAGASVITAAWEAQFCANDVTRPGTFYIKREAVIGLIARFHFTRALHLIDLTGSTASKLGIYDALASPEHEWCQWFGCQLDQVISGSADDIDGIRYMSRKHPGQLAFALSSRAIDRLDAVRTTTVSSFTDESAFIDLQRDPCFVLPP